MTSQERWNVYHSYLLMKVFEKDWHGVQDAGSDLRELEVEIKLQEKQLNEFQKCSSEDSKEGRSIKERSGSDSRISFTRSERSSQESKPKIETSKR